LPATGANVEAYEAGPRRIIPDHMDVDHCVASVQSTGQLPRSRSYQQATSWRLQGTVQDGSKALSPARLSLRRPSRTPVGKAPPCTGPRLLAGYGTQPQTASQSTGQLKPYKWVTGLTVWEDGKRILQVCVGAAMMPSKNALHSDAPALRAGSLARKLARRRDRGR